MITEATKCIALHAVGNSLAIFRRVLYFDMRIDIGDVLVSLRSRRVIQIGRVIIILRDHFCENDFGIFDAYFSLVFLIYVVSVLEYVSCSINRYILHIDYKINF